MRFSINLRPLIRLLTALAVGLMLQPAQADEGFARWIQSFKATAISQGVTAQVYDDAFRGVTEPDAAVLEKANYQPEFKAEAWEYMDGRIQERAITTGQAMLQ